MHWIIVIFLAPFGSYNPILAIAATVGYLVMLYFVLFSKGVKVENIFEAS
jgi:hypothetical protein